MSLESDLTIAARNAMLKAFPGGKYYKNLATPADRGKPDSSFTWNGPTSWLEFKHLDHGQSIHSEGALKKHQLVELVQLQRASGRAWVIAYRKPTRSLEAHTTIYKPNALIRGAQPFPKEYSSHENVVRDLIRFGVAAFPGYDHQALVALIRITHDAG